MHSLAPPHFWLEFSVDFGMEFDRSGLHRYGVEFLAANPIPMMQMLHSSPELLPFKYGWTISSTTRFVIFPIGD